MKRFSLITILICSGLIAVMAIFGFQLYFGNDVEKLVNNYPFYNLKSSKYELKSEKPLSWVSVDQVSNEAKWAIIVSEDWAFYNHKGLDTEQIKITIEESIKEEKLVRGASTITQQVIKNTLLTNERSLWRKFKEAILSYKLEKYLSKDKILEIYLNIIELGDGVYGIKQASSLYFNKHPSKLTAREGAFLAMLLPSPKKYSISFRKKELTPFARKIVESVLIKMRQAKIYSKSEWLAYRKDFFDWEIVSPDYRESILKVEMDYRKKESLEIKQVIKDSNVTVDEEFLDYNVYE